MNEELLKLIDDLYWEYDRMSTSGQERLDKIAMILDQQRKKK